MRVNNSDQFCMRIEAIQYETFGERILFEFIDLAQSVCVCVWVFGFFSAYGAVGIYVYLFDWIDFEVQYT